MVGTSVRQALAQRGLSSLQLVRRKTTRKDELQWDPTADPAIPVTEPLEGTLAAIHLSGANVGAHRWTEGYKREMIASRVDSTRRLATTLAGLRNPPKTLLIASAIGIYGDRGEAVVDESSTAGEGFLAELCQKWETAADPAIQAGIRIVHLRFGVVLGPEGALKQMLPPFKFGLGAQLGSGRQWMSWVGLEDAIAKIGQEIHSQYLITYTPNNKEEGGWHDIRVTVSGRTDLKVRSRPGYWVASSF